MKGLGRVSRAKAGILAFIAGLFAAQEFSAHRLSSEQNTRKGIIRNVSLTSQRFKLEDIGLHHQFLTRTFFFGLVKTVGT